MTLIVETGEGLANANSFDSVENADVYHAERGNSEWTGTLEEKSQAMIRASSVVSTSNKWPGERRRYRQQGLEWPRVGAVDVDGIGIPGTEIPIEIKHATYEVALRERVKPGSMTPDVTLSSTVKSASIGSMSVEFLASGNSASAARPTLLIVDAILARILPNRGTMVSGYTVRV